MGATDDDAPHIEANTEPEAVNRSKAFDKAIELAPLCSSLAQVARAVNDALGLDWTAGAWRGLWVRNPTERNQVRERLNALPPLADVEIVGVTADEQLPDAQAVLQRSIAKFNQLRETMNRRRQQTIRFPNRPVGISFAADNHIGNEGVDYERMFAEAQLIADTDNLYAINVGDVVDNFIIGKLMALRMFTSVSIPEEWALAKHYLETIGPKLLALVSGNHDQWSTAVGGVDQLRDVLSHVRPDALYGTDELLVNIEVGPLSIPARIRHKWQYSSVLNPTHGIERAFERDQAKPFLLGVGAHTHVSGLSAGCSAVLWESSSTPI